MTHVFRVIAETTERSGAQLVMAPGGNIDRAVLGGLAASTIVVKHAPQLELLRRAKPCITHAGLNTALEALSFVVPMVAIPVTNDQPGVAARIRYTQTGLSVGLGGLTAGKLKRAVDRVWTDERYGANARRVRDAIASRDGLNQAADIIEQVFGAA